MKSQGELVELKFYLKAMEEGFIVSKPFGDNTHYDFIIDCRGELSRVQIKSTSVAEKENSYGIMVSYGRDSKIPYTKKEIDFLIAYIIPVDTWYIIPVEKLNAMKKIRINLDNDKNTYYLHKEAWFLLEKVTHKAKVSFSKSLGKWMIYYKQRVATGRPWKRLYSHNGKSFQNKEQAEEAIKVIWPSLET